MKRFFQKSILCLLTLTFFYAVSYAEKGKGNITYVNASATGLNNGSTWMDAYTDLQTALNDPRSNEIWVAEGIYAPVVSVSDETNGFFIDGFGAQGKVFGGFKGDETELNQRNTKEYICILEVSNQTILDSRSIIYSTSKSNDIVFDGFTISTLLSNEEDVVLELVINTRLVNCWVGSVLVNNLADFSSISDRHDRLKSSFEDEDSFELASIDETTFSVYPTIATSQITIESSVPSEVEIIDYLGNIVFTAQMTESPLQINVSDLPKGIYIARVTNLNFGVKTTRVVLK